MSDLDKAFGEKILAGFNVDTPIGTRVGGVITAEAEVRQMRKFKNGQPTDELATWDNGDPMNQVRVVVQTELREDGEDDGRRALFVKTWGTQKAALMAAVRAAGYQKLSEALTPGNSLFDTFVKEDPSTTPATKIHGYEIVRGSATSLDQAVSEPAPTTTPDAGVQEAQASGANKLESARELIKLGLEDAEIAQSLGLVPIVVTKLREQVAASNDAPF